MTVPPVQSALQPHSGASAMPQRLPAVPGQHAVALQLNQADSVGLPPLMLMVRDMNVAGIHSISKATLLPIFPTVVVL
jgi:hypothetical protein